jgi:hypothetical protein
MKPKNSEPDASVVLLSYPRFAELHTAVCWDKDSTIANTAHRHSMIPEIQAGRKTWREYALACETDTPVLAARALMKMLAPKHLQIVTSGATEEAVVPIARWLLDKDFPADMIRLRPQGDMVDNALLKVRMLRELEEEGIEVVLFVEDNPVTASVIESMTGIPVMLLNPCYSESSKAMGAGSDGNI